MRRFIALLFVLLLTTPAAVADTKPHRVKDGPRLSVGLPGDVSARPGYFLDDTQLTLDELLSLTGEEEVIASMKRRRWIKRGMIAGGVVTMGVGVLVATSGLDCGEIRNPDAQQECDNDNTSRRLKAGVIIGAGALLAAVSFAIHSGKPSGNQLRSWADRYNRVEVAPEVSANGGGVVLSGRF